MAIYDLLPKFDYIEPNNLKGLQAGLVVAQMPVADTAKDTVLKDNKYMENGTICTISKDGIVAPTTATSPLFICFSEPLNTLVDSDALYAVNVNEELPRLVQLMPGDEWMSTKALKLDTGVLQNRIVEIKDTDGMGKSDDWFKCTTMANGDKGHHYMFIG